jgi:excinuclease ABC subunit B
MRHSATRAILERNDVIIVASVSCIYGIGSRESYKEMTTYVAIGRPLARDAFLRQLVEGQFERNDVDFSRGTFRVRGDTVEVFPAHEEETALRFSFFGDEVERISVVDPLRGKIVADLDHVTIWPASHYAMSVDRRRRALESIRVELLDRLQELRRDNHLLEAQRLEQRTLYDLEMLEATGACKGVENYSRHLSGGKPGEPPTTLMDYFPPDFLMLIDESHQSVPQVRGMYFGDRARKETLVRYGFRLPSALDNRPLKFDEFAAHLHTVLYISATPADYELDQAQGVVVEQLIRPTGLLDPIVEIRPVGTQVDDLIAEAKKVVAKGQRVLVTTLTKRMAEDLTEYLVEVGMRTRYLHSDVDTLERIEILAGLRRGEYDVLVGINLLREGLDLPEVSLVAILDADKEGFLRSETSLVQTIGRAARNIDGRVVLYADRITGSMERAMAETNRRRARQVAYNEANGITPESVRRDIADILDSPYEKGDRVTIDAGVADNAKPFLGSNFQTTLKDLETKMREAASNLEFETAARLRDEIKRLKMLDLEFAKDMVGP